MQWNINDFNSWFNGIIIFINIILILWILYTSRPRFLSKKYRIVLNQMSKDGMIIIIRLSEDKFQIIYQDGHAINTWHPDFVKFFSFMKINEILDINSLKG